MCNTSKDNIPIFPFPATGFLGFLYIIPHRSDDVFLPYNTVPRLSGGEQQLIEFYREYKKKYLILDEPTSKLSDENERMVFKEIMSHDGLRIIITQQLKYLKQVDEIILVENGTIMCHG